jgi:hypothetical protein
MDDVLISCVQEFVKLREAEAASDFILDILDIIERYLLRLRVPERVNCAEIVQRFAAIQERCDWDPGYCTQKTSRDLPRTPTDLSDRLEERVRVVISPEMKEEYNLLLPNHDPLPSQSTTPAGTVREDDQSGTLGYGADDASSAHMPPSMKSKHPPSFNEQQPLPSRSGEFERSAKSPGILSSQRKGHRRVWNRMRKIVKGCFGASGN